MALNCKFAWTRAALRLTDRRVCMTRSRPLAFVLYCVGASTLPRRMWRPTPPGMRTHAQLRGYDHEANMQGRCLLQAASHEIAAAAALEQVCSASASFAKPGFDMFFFRDLTFLFSFFPYGYPHANQRARTTSLLLIVPPQVPRCRERER